MTVRKAGNIYTRNSTSWGPATLCHFRFRRVGGGVYEVNKSHVTHVRLEVRTWPVADSTHKHLLSFVRNLCQTVQRPRT